ncbi:MAG: NAD(P)-binding domain-containing protein [Sphingomonadales bacterium]|nr:NAD(P)-binding domain-containing protein [Sphingomonadales bacterium]
MRFEGKACIIGAGTSGLITAKVFQEHNIDFDCFEKGSGLGGIWRFQNDNAVSTCYRSLHINTSKRMMELSDFKFRPEIAEYPSHKEILSEFERYADQFDVRSRITFSTEVVHVGKRDDGKWDVTILQNGKTETRTYGFLAVANGHHWDPRYPKFEGSFDGITLHAHHYVDAETPHDLRDKRVVVVGMGNSAMDIACELARMGQGAEKLYLAQRSGVWIIPKILGNIAQDKFIRHPMKKPSLWEKFKRTFIPRTIRVYFNDMLLETIIKVLVGMPKRVGLKNPHEKFHQRHPTVSQEVHNRLIHGDITPKGNIKRLMGDSVEFEDGSVEKVDAIIYATGYNITFPFFDESFIAAEQNSIPLWMRMFDPAHKNLAFIALVQPVCAMMPIAELQANFVADYVIGEVALPNKDDMIKEMAAYDQMMKDNYTSSLSHTIQIDCPEYSYVVQKAWKRLKTNRIAP